MKLSRLIRSDLERYTQTYRLRGQRYSRWKILLESFLFKAGFQAAFLYRVSHWLYKHGLSYPAWFVARINISFTGAEIEYNAEIGPGLFISHPVGIVIGRGTVIGWNATLFQGVSFGVKSWHPDDIRKFPKVGDHCFFFAHAAVLGDVDIGDYCLVAANAVVTKNLPDGSLAKGVPAEIIPHKGKETIASWFEEKVAL